MNFSEFQQFRENLLRTRRDVIDCAATNLYAALARLIPPAAPAPECKVHRCHLAAEWVDRFGLPSNLTRRALVSCGVRDSLATLFRHYACEKALLWLPEDNYPVYGELAHAAGLVLRKFSTLPEPGWPNDPPIGGAELLLITNPLKPVGRWLSADDVAALSAWLAQSPRRRILLDAVYTFETRFHPTTLQLLATGQAILLHSLTKGWLHPRLFGVAAVPECDAPALTSAFRAQPPPQANLARARQLLSDYYELPVAVSRELQSARTRLFSSVPSCTLPATKSDAFGYFTPIAGRWQDILHSGHILGLPASVFGSRREDITILSSLSFLS